MFVWVFFENLGKDLYHPSNYAGLIKNYIENGSAPEAWKQVMAFMVNHASIAAPLQGLTEISLGVLLLLGLLPRLRRWLRSRFSAVSGFRNGARPGFGSCWSQFWLLSRW